MAQESTRLSPQEERQFQQWALNNGIANFDDPRTRYDYRGYWKSVASRGGDQTKQYGDGPHFPDTYKQHGHPTFSVESQYSSGPYDGGRWVGEDYVPQGADLMMTSRGAARLPQQTGMTLGELMRMALLASRGMR